MKNPPRRDRLVTYYSGWERGFSTKGIYLSTLVIHHDCILKSFNLGGSIMIVKAQNMKTADEVVCKISEDLQRLGLKAFGGIIGEKLGDRVWEYRLASLQGAKIQGSSREVLCFINKLGSVLGFPVTTELSVTVAWREVFVMGHHGHREWISESRWLLESASPST